MPAHIHKNAWLSGVTYLNVPGDMGAEPAGHIEFGRPPADELRYTYEPETQTIAPTEGMLLRTSRGT